MRTFCIGVDIAWWGGGKRHYARALHALLPRGRSALDQLRHLNIFAKKEESKTAEGFVVDSHPRGQHLGQSSITMASCVDCQQGLAF
jgi:hypothetical protein